MLPFYPCNGQAPATRPAAAESLQEHHLRRIFSGTNTGFPPHRAELPITLPRTLLAGNSQLQEHTSVLKKSNLHKFKTLKQRFCQVGNVVSGAAKLGCNRKAGQQSVFLVLLRTILPSPGQVTITPDRGEAEKTRAETSAGTSWAGELGRLSCFLSWASREMCLGRSLVSGLWCWHQ